MYMQRALCVGKVEYKKGQEISLFYNGKVMDY